MSRLSILRLGLACFAFAAGLLIDGNIGRIVHDGIFVQSAEAARARRTVVRGPRGTYKRTVVRGPRGVYKRTVVRGRPYAGRRHSCAPAPISAPFPAAAPASTAMAMSCGVAAASIISPMAAATSSSGSNLTVSSWPALAPAIHFRCRPTVDVGPRDNGETALTATWGGIGDPGRTRTSDQQLRRLLLYPAELRGRNSS